MPHCEWYSTILKHANACALGTLARLTDAIGGNYASYVVMLLNAVCYVVAFNTMKLHPDVKQGTINVARGLIGVAVCPTVLWIQQKDEEEAAAAAAAAIVVPPAIPPTPPAPVTKDKAYIRTPKYFRLLAVRVVLVSLSQIVYGIMVRWVQVSTIMIITNIAPIIVLLISAFFYAVPTTRRDYAGACIGFFGLTLVLNPEWLFGEGALASDGAPRAHQFEYAEGVQRYVCIGVLLAVTVTWAYTIIMVRQMAGHVSTVQLTLYQSIGYTIMGSLHQVAYADTQSVDDPALFAQIGVAYGIGLLFFFCQLAFFGALNVTKNPGKTAMVNYMQVILGYVVEIVFYGETPTGAQTFGVACVIWGVGMTLIKES